METICYYQHFDLFVSVTQQEHYNLIELGMKRLLGQQKIFLDNFGEMIIGLAEKQDFGVTVVEPIEDTNSPGKR